MFIPVLLVLVAACGLPSGSGESVSMSGEHYELAITHRLDVAALDQEEEAWTESDFLPVDDGGRFLISVDSDGHSIVLQSLTDDVVMTGHLDTHVANPADVVAEESTRFFIDEGLFAGGSLVIWSQNDGLRAELTTYGSGRPVIASERGDLELAA